MSTDLVVSFDTTGSMSPCIAEVRRRVTEALGKLFGSIPDLRICVLAHGDYCDEDRPYIIKYTSFHSKPGPLEAFVRDVPNTNGGDSDECYEAVLQTVKDFDWIADTRILIMIGDALPHEPGYRYGGNRWNIDWREQVRGLTNIGVNIYSVQCLGSRHSAHFWKAMADMTNGRHVDLAQFSDIVETLTAITYHSQGRAWEYRDELLDLGKMNRALAVIFDRLNAPVENVRYTGTDKTGLIPVDPHRFQRVHVDSRWDIRAFVHSLGIRYVAGRGFYLLTKPEMIQERKEVILRNRITGDMFTGSEARLHIGLPFGVRGKVRPPHDPEYEIYVQSTSYTRVLMPGTTFLYENL